ncbi:unnamed protein product [Nezara viridula]|uniref:Ig-like domain-containing protein n=1 Tax=Nezara viridula TaxID=85310 RepID=A0A9P0EDE5_NEZVI|nr:unnamed protein product [Nezara viridula]
MKPIMEDDGKELTCRAVNPKYPSEYIEARRTISVACEFTNPATAEVEVLSGPMGGNHIREGETIKLGCKIKSNPPPDKILWYHENRQVKVVMAEGLSNKKIREKEKNAGTRRLRTWRIPIPRTHSEISRKPKSLLESFRPSCEIEEDLPLKRE